MMALLIFAAVLCLGSLLIAVALFTPVVLVVDSSHACVRVRWLFGVEFRHSLAAHRGEGRRRREAKRAAARGRFLYRCLLNAGVRRAVFRSVVRLLRGILRSVEFTRWRVNLSLPDPAVTGILSGFLQAGWGAGTPVQADFTGENSFLVEIRIHPHRIVRPVLVFLAELPYRTIWREWRAAPAP